MSFKFLNFLHNKSFKNIFDYDENFNIDDIIKTSELVKNGVNEDRSILNFNSNVNEYIPYFRDDKFVPILKAYKELFLYNDYNLCGYFVLAPLFLSPSILHINIRMHQLTNDQLYINNIVFNIVQNIKKTIPTMKDKLDRYTTIIDDKIKSLTFGDIKTILNSIGLQMEVRNLIRHNNSLHFRVLKDNVKYIKYPILYYKIRDQQGRDKLHVEIAECFDDILFINEYLTVEEEEELDDEMSVEDDEDTDVSSEEVGMNRNNRRKIIPMYSRNKRINNNNNNSRIPINNNKSINNNGFRMKTKIRRINRNNNRSLRNISRTIKRENNNILKYSQTKSVNLQIRRNNRDMIVNGKDLIVKNDDNYINETNGLYYIIPINPSYWESTRIKNIAVLNQSFIPLSINIEFIPIVSKLQKGNITIGCITNSTMNEDNIQNVLISSTSGCTFSCSSKFSKNIELSSLIPQRKLLISEKLDNESCPFYIYILLNNITNDQDNFISPGQFYINYSFKFFNPITNPIDFKLEQNKRVDQFDKNYTNISCILTESNRTFDIGTKIDIEKVAPNAYNFLLNGTKVDLDLDKYCFFFYSKQVNDFKYTFSLKDFTRLDEQTSVSFNDRLYIYSIMNNRFTVWQNTQFPTPTTLNIEAGSYIYVNGDGEIGDVMDFPIILTITNYSEAYHAYYFYGYPQNTNFIDL